MLVPSSRDLIVLKVYNEETIRRFYFSCGQPASSSITSTRTPLLDALIAKIRHVFGINTVPMSEQNSNSFSLIYKNSIPKTIIPNNHGWDMNGQLLHVNSDEILVQLIKNSLETNSDLRLIIDHNYAAMGYSNNASTPTSSNTTASTKPVIPKPLPTIPVVTNNNSTTAVVDASTKITSNQTTKTTILTPRELTLKIMEKTTNLSEPAREKLFEKCLKFIDDCLNQVDPSENKPLNSYGKETTHFGSTPSSLSNSSALQQDITYPSEEHQPNKYGRKLATFVADLSIPDHTKMKPGEHFKKTWKFKNCGTRALPKNCKLMFLQGKKANFLNAPEFVALKNRENEIQVGQEFQVSVDLQAPSTSGVYSAYFRLADEEGILFGYKVWACVDVVLE
ncbi:hypothetical protein C9374_013518 [Naegleria lovaniensis]|uniref:Nbr1 FW domain-containing protein n=1 Tax=Naegleria lovaniensis TaxID=51637 RepID=A0AA88KNF4_NAELO|nr:uncharacterized protein C9374_013518 [Naegleria lovaniensis]KAG2392033.1 hypothetical protein C9374_013518 [Naegleria lovaniensis]